MPEKGPPPFWTDLRRPGLEMWARAFSSCRRPRQHQRPPILLRHRRRRHERAQHTQRAPRLARTGYRWSNLTAATCVHGPSEKRENVYALDEHAGRLVESLAYSCEDPELTGSLGF